MSQALKQLHLPFDIPPVPEKSGRPRQVRLARGIFDYHLVRARRRSIALFVDAEGIEVRAPRHATIAEIEVFIQEKERWIGRRLAEPRRLPFVWETGARLPWLGRLVTLEEKPGESGVWLSGDRLEFGLADGAGLRERALEWMREQALAFFRERVAALSDPHGLHVSGVGLSNAQTRWGSCSVDGRVLLNWRLISMPPHIIDYVAVHELAHLRELNHSPRFWNIVATLYPDYAAARRELNALARTLPEL